MHSAFPLVFMHSFATVTVDHERNGSGIRTFISTDHFRDKYNKPMRMNKGRGTYEWDESTVKVVHRTDWWTRDSAVSFDLNIIKSL